MCVCDRFKKYKQAGSHSNSFRLSNGRADDTGEAVCVCVCVIVPLVLCLMRVSVCVRKTKCGVLLKKFSSIFICTNNSCLCVISWSLFNCIPCNMFPSSGHYMKHHFTDSFKVCFQQKKTLQRGWSINLTFSIFFFSFFFQ